MPWSWKLPPGTGIDAQQDSLLSAPQSAGSAWQVPSHWIVGPQLGVGEGPQGIQSFAGSGFEHWPWQSMKPPQRPQLAPVPGGSDGEHEPSH